MGWIRVLAILVVSSVPLAFGQAASGRIEGNVFLDDGTAIPGAVIVAMRPLPQQSTAGTAVSDKAGHFSVAGLAPGSYSLCVHAGYSIDPCAWSAATPKITISAGEISSGNVLRVAKGSLLRVRLNDPAQSLKLQTTGVVPNHVLLGVWTPARLFLPLTKIGEDASGRDYLIGIPHDTPITVSLTSTTLHVVDSQSVPIPVAGLNLTVQHATGQPDPPPLTFTITGIAH